MESYLSYALTNPKCIVYFFEADTALGSKLLQPTFSSFFLSLHSYNMREESSPLILRQSYICTIIIM